MSKHWSGTRTKHPGDNCCLLSVCRVSKGSRFTLSTTLSWMVHLNAREVKKYLFAKSVRKEEDEWKSNCRAQ